VKKKRVSNAQPGTQEHVKKPVRVLLDFTDARRVRGAEVHEPHIRDAAFGPAKKRILQRASRHSRGKGPHAPTQSKKKEGGRKSGEERPNDGNAKKMALKNGEAVDKLRTMDVQVLEVEKNW